MGKNMWGSIILMLFAGLNSVENAEDKSKQLLEYLKIKAGSTYPFVSSG